MCWDRRSQKWRAQIRVDGRQRTIGRFAVEADAARAYNAVAAEEFGEFAWLNVIEEEAA